MRAPQHPRSLPVRPRPALLLVLVAALAAGCSGVTTGSTSTGSSVPAATDSASSSGAATSPGARSLTPTSLTPSSESSNATATAASVNSALPQLSSFVAEARATDAALRALSLRVNAGIDSGSIRIDPADLTTLRAIVPHRLVAAIPGGLPDPLLRSTLLVFADLVSRRDAFNRWDEFASESPVPRTGAHGKDLLRCLGNGASAAAHFDADLAALTAAAAATPRVAVAPAASHATAEVSIQAELIEGVNGGCAECGGFVARPTVLWPITWKRIVLAPDSIWDGTIGTTPFQARYTPSGGWTANLDAC